MNKKITFKITLLSDACLGNGTGNGTDVDVVCCFDDCGFPEIPAKRIKGLLREKAFMLADNGKFTNDEVISLFGGLNGKSSRMQIENACLEDISELTSLSGEYSAFEMRKAFADIRKQTAIEYETGIAKKSSYRTIEIINKGLCFLSDITVYNVRENDIKIIESALKLLRVMGNNKNRGLGEIKCEILRVDDIDVSLDLSYQKSDDRKKIDFTLSLLQDVTFKTDSPVQQLNYIPGSSLQGFFANKLRDCAFFYDAIFNDLQFSNAYISDGKKRYLPCPGYLTGVKNKTDAVYSLADNYDKDKGKQYVGVNGYGFFDGECYEKKDVGLGSEYHINRENKDLFSFEKIKKNQVFKGTIFGSDPAIRLIKSVLESNNNFVYVGSSTTAQYGKCKMELTEAHEETVNIYDGENMVVELVSDLVCIDEYGNNTVKTEVLAEEIKKIIPFEDYQSFIKTGIVGGYNAKWGMPKIQREVFLKGSALLLKNCKAATVPESIMIGTENPEGYGEIRIRKQFGVDTFTLKTAEIKDESKATEYSKKTNELKEKLHKNRETQKVKIAAWNFAEDKSSVQTELSNSAAMRIMNLLLGINGKDAYISFKNNLHNFEKNKELYRLADDLCKKFDELRVSNEDKMFEVFIRSFISRYKELYQLTKKESLVKEGDINE